jgi:2-keto-4-pentenoate hydratase
MTDEARLIRLLADAQRNGTRTIDASMLTDLDRAAAYRIQAGVRDELGESIGMIKTAVQPNAVVAAPIFDSRLARTPGARLPAATVIGLEVEVGLVLAHDIPTGPDVDEHQVAAAVDHYFTGIEVISTRFIDRDAASPAAGLADYMSAFGYVIGGRRERGPEIDGATVTLEFAGRQIYSAPAKHGFGTVLASLVAYAREQDPELPLKSGTIVTTGSLCGLVKCSGPGHIVARLDSDVVEADLI